MSMRRSKRLRDKSKRPIWRQGTRICFSCNGQLMEMLVYKGRVELDAQSELFDYMVAKYGFESGLTMTSGPTKWVL
jgi:hypothetical protein